MNRPLMKPPDLEVPDLDPLVGNKFDIICPREGFPDLQAVPKEMFGSSLEMESYPVHKFLECNPEYSRPQVEAHVKRYYRPKNILWLGLEEFRASPAEGQTEEDVKNDIVYFRTAETKPPTPRNPVKEFWRDYDCEDYDIPCTVEGLEKHLDNIINLLKDGLCVPYAIDLVPDTIVEPTETESGVYEPTEIDHFVLNLDPKLNPDLADRPGVTRPTYNIGGTWSFVPSHYEDGLSDSSSLQLYGGPKAWCCIRPEHWQTVSAKVSDILSRCKDPRAKKYWGSGKRFCPMPLHHKQLLIAPAQLRAWGIPFELTLQYPGEVMYLKGLVIHYIVNLRPSGSLATNNGSDAWNRTWYYFSPCGCIHDGIRGVIGNISKISSVRAIEDKYHRCKYDRCDAIFFLKETLDNHIRDHKQKKTRYTCVRCHRTYLDPMEMSNHISVCSSDDRSAPCSRCLNRYTKRYLPVHQKKECVETSKCVCGKTFERESGFAKHEKTCSVAHPEKKASKNNRKKARVEFYDREESRPAGSSGQAAFTARTGLVATPAASKLFEGKEVYIVLNRLSKISMGLLAPVPATASDGAHSSSAAEVGSSKDFSETGYADSSRPLLVSTSSSPSLISDEPTESLLSLPTAASTSQNLQSRSSAVEDKPSSHAVLETIPSTSSISEPITSCHDSRRSSTVSPIPDLADLLETIVIESEHESTLPVVSNAVNVAIDHSYSAPGPDAESVAPSKNVDLSISTMILHDTTATTESSSRVAGADGTSLKCESVRPCLICGRYLNHPLTCPFGYVCICGRTNFKTLDALSQHRNACPTVRDASQAVLDDSPWD